MKNPIFKKGHIYKSVLKNPGKIVKVLEDSDEETPTFNCVIIYIHDKEMETLEKEGDTTWFGKRWFQKMNELEDTSSIEEFLHDRIYVKSFPVEQVTPKPYNDKLFIDVK
jgi:hypothetical protein